MGLNKRESPELDITDATATPDEVKIGEVFYNNDGRQVGLLEMSSGGLESYAFGMNIESGHTPLEARKQIFVYNPYTHNFAKTYAYVHNIFPLSCINNKSIKEIKCNNISVYIGNLTYFNAVTYTADLNLTNSRFGFEFSIPVTGETFFLLNESNSLKMCTKEEIPLRDYESDIVLFY